MKKKVDYKSLRIKIIQKVSNTGIRTEIYENVTRAPRGKVVVLIKTTTLNMVY